MVIRSVPFCYITLSAQKPPDPRNPTELRTIGDHPRRTRLDRSLTARRVATLFGINWNTYYGWENGRDHPGRRWFGQIEAFLGYRPDDFIPPLLWGIASRLSPKIPVVRGAVRRDFRGPHRHIITV